MSYCGSCRWALVPVEGCTMPAVPPIPSTLCGTRGSTPPMGMRQYSSSSIFLRSRPILVNSFLPAHEAFIAPTRRHGPLALAHWCCAGHVQFARQGQ